jgi:SAM-dependent methyltransferase
VAAARAGYRVIGIDPSLKSLRAARRAAQQLGVEVDYLVGDGRHLPFAGGTVDQVFSYSVLQHLSKENARATLREAARVLRKDGQCLVQMPNVFGVRCFYHQLRRGFRETRDFEVRYWTVPELARTFSEIVGPSRVFVDGYFTLNPQMSDIHLFPPRYRAIVRFSEMLRKMSSSFPPLKYVADSLYVSSVRQ